MLSLYANVVASGVLMGLVYALVALGLTIMFGVMKMVNFAHGEMVVIGMYLGYALWSAFGIAPWLAMPLAAVLMFAFGYVLQTVLVNRFISRPQHIQFILFIGLAFVITGLQLMLFGPDTRSIGGSASFDVVRLGLLRLDLARLQGGALALLLLLLVLAFLRFSTVGASIRAAADNQIGAQAIGLRVRRVYAITAGIGLACAGAAGALVAPIFDVEPTLAQGFTMIAFVTVIIGGLGSLTGALVGGILIGVSESLAALLINPAMKSMISYGLLIAMLLIRPEGLFGKRSR
ncbi:MAG: branched-chain amino acid ABC transporter permease [Burkholderiaceae bacterium]|jgi:branched-chain amino acid transport system permease protein|nr:branched-chain amino acid ABC transporter permease [Burkholderiaceae bacterium]